MGFSCEAKDAATLAFMNHSSVAVREPIAKVTMPLFADQEGVGWLCATGVLLKVGGKHFIVSAAHNFDNWPDRIPLNITDGVDGIFMMGEVLLRRFPTKHPENRLLDEPTDVAVCDLSQATVDRVLAGGRFRFLELDEVEPWARQDMRDWFKVFGFPGDLNKDEVAPNVLGSNACAFATFLYGGERGDIPLRPMERGVCFLLDYCRTTTKDDSGANVTPPHPCGMSGGGIWRIAQYGSEIRDWSLKKLKLVGIQSSFYEPEDVLRCTRIEHTLGVIYRWHPDLQPEFDQRFGREECQRRFALPS